MIYQKLAVVFTAVLLFTACEDPKSEDSTNNNQKTSEVKLESAIDKASYAIGHGFAKDLKHNGLPDINIKNITLGMQDALDGKDSKVSEEEMMQAFTTLQTRNAERIAKEKEENAKASADFLAENGKREGVVTTASGLQYEILHKAENGKKPIYSDTVKAHYEGKLINGKVFDSSIERGEPAEFPIAGVIDGWKEGLALMEVGDKFKLFIPADLAYGENGPGEIPPNSALIFEVELLEIADNSGNSIETTDPNVK